MRVITAALALVILTSPASLLAQSSQFTDPQPSISVPRLVNVSGVFQPADGQPPAPVEVVTLSIYAAPEGGVPLWQEMQSVVVDTTGRFTVLLGASHPDGLPPALFASGEAQWMSLQFARAGEVERSRVRIASVPYALKARDAETLGGRPASAYLLAPTEGDETGRAAGAKAEDSSATAAEPPVAADLVLPGTTNFLAKYVNGAAGTVGNAAVVEIGGRVGIGMSTFPFDALHVRFSDPTGSITGVAVQNMSNSATSYSGMLFYDQAGALAQFQGFNNVTHEYRINNIASNGSINFMLGGTSRFRVDSTAGTVISGPASIIAGNPTVGLLVSGGTTGISVGVSSPNGSGVFGDNPLGRGVFGATDTGFGVLGVATNVAAAWAGFFDGDVNVTGNLFKGGGAFRIDHPLDPENKYLSHSFVESPDMKNIYDGVAVLDEAGEAIITLPDWFEALNGDFRYQLTPMGAAFVPYVAEEITGNQFKVAGGIPGRKVSWQVTGIRHDAFANAHRIQVEEQKPDAAVGTYLHPEAFGQTVETTLTAADATATAKDRDAARAEAMNARLRAIGQKPAKQ